MTDEPKFITLAGGRLIDVNTGQGAVDTKINRAFADSGSQSSKRKRASTLENTTRRFLDDLPVPSFQSRPVAVIAAYVLFGLSEVDIAYLLQTDVQNVTNIIESEGFEKFVDGMLQNVREHDLDKVRKKINESALSAAEKITDLVGSRDEKVSLAAAKDVLDRVGSGALSNDPGSRGAGGFTIRIIDDKDSPNSGVEVEVKL